MELQFFVFDSIKSLGKRIENHLGIPISPMEERNFEDGEHKCRPLESVRDRDVFVLQSLYSEPGMSVNDKICRLLFFVSALKDASAKKVTALIPYFAYARKDQKTKSRDPVTMKYMARLLETAGVDQVITIDIHNVAAFQNAFQIPVEHLEGRVLFAPYFAKMPIKEEIIIVSPDAGGFKRAEQFQRTLSQLLNRTVDLAFIAKNRSEGVVQGGQYVIGDVKNKFAIIIDDIISSGRTLKLAVDALAHQGAKRIMACATHGAFTSQINDALKEPKLEKVIIADTIQTQWVDKNLLENKVIITDSSILFAKAMKRMQGGDSLVRLMEEYPYFTQESSLRS